MHGSDALTTLMKNRGSLLNIEISLPVTSRHIMPPLCSLPLGRQEEPRGGAGALTGGQRQDGVQAEVQLSGAAPWGSILPEGGGGQAPDAQNADQGGSTPALHTNRLGMGGGERHLL